MTTMGVYVRDLLLGQVCFQLMYALCIARNLMPALAFVSSFQVGKSLNYLMKITSI